MSAWSDMTSNPINQRRWQQFRQNKRGYYALWIFIAHLILKFIYLKLLVYSFCFFVVEQGF